MDLGYDSLANGRGVPAAKSRQIAGERAIMRAAGAGRMRLPPAGVHVASSVREAKAGGQEDLMVHNGWNTPNTNLRAPRLKNKVISNGPGKARQGPLAPLPNGTGWGGGVPLVLDVRQSGIGARLWEREAPGVGERVHALQEIGGAVRNDDNIRRSDDNVCAALGQARGDTHDIPLGRVGGFRRGSAMRRPGVGAGVSTPFRRAGPGHSGTPLMQQVVSPSRQQLRMWQAMADNACSDVDAGLAPSDAAEAEASGEPRIFQRVGSTGVTSERQQAGDRERGRGHAEKDARLSVGRNGVYSARELKRSSLHTRAGGGLPAGGEVVGVGGVLGMGVGSGKPSQERGKAGEARDPGRLRQLPSARAPDEVKAGARSSVQGNAHLETMAPGVADGTRRGATRGVMVVTDDLDGLPAEIAAARLRRRMLSDVWSGFQDAEGVTAKMRLGQSACKGIYIGGVVVACREGPLREAGITHIVNVTPNEKDFFPRSFSYLRVPVNDSASGRMNQHWDKAYRFMADAVDGGGRVFVHCSAGVSRSATLVLYFMMRHHKMTLLAAYQMLKKARGCVAPNFSFWAQLVEAERALRFGTSCSVSAYKKLRLLEAFPSCSPADAEAALKRCNGDMDQAAAVIGMVNPDGADSRG